MSPRISIRLLAAQSDQRLAELAEEGHERAFEALVQRYRRPLLRYCRRMRLSEARCEDVLQQAFLQAWMAFAGGADVRDVRPWLYRIVHNVTVNSMRGSVAGYVELTEAMHDRASLAGESELQHKMSLHDALSDVAALPRMQQRAIFLSAVDGQSHDEVASVLGISEGAVRGLLHRARTTLRSAAAALTPPQLLEWASGGSGPVGPSAERLAELSAGPGAAGLGGLLLKGAVVAVTAGAVATGATVASSDGQGSHGQAHRARVTRLTGATAVADRPAGELAATVSLSTGREDARGRSGPGRRHGRGEHARRGRDGSGSGEHRLATSTSDDSAHGHQGSGDSGSQVAALDDRRGSSSGGSGSLTGQSSSGGSGKGSDGSGSGSSSGSSGSGGGNDSQIVTTTTSAEQPVAVASDPSQASSTSGSKGGDDALASAPVSSGSGSKGGSGSDG